MSLWYSQATSAHNQKFYFQVVLAEMVTKDELLAKLMQLKPCSIDEALADGQYQGRVVGTASDEQHGNEPMTKTSLRATLG